MHVAIPIRCSHLPNAESDATLLNGHLEWLTKVGFSVDNILEWAEAEKSKRGTDSTQQSALSAEEPEQLALTVSVAIEKAFTDGGSRLTDKGQSQSSATVDDASNLEDFPAFHSGNITKMHNIILAINYVCGIMNIAIAR